MAAALVPCGGRGGGVVCLLTDVVEQVLAEMGRMGRRGRMGRIGQHDRRESGLRDARADADQHHDESSDSGRE